MNQVPEYSYSVLKDKLVSAGLKATHQRIVILEALLKLNNHPTAEYIYSYIRPANPSIYLGTVYKTLHLFVENDLIGKVVTDNGSTRYDAHTLLHSHIYCANTKEIIDFHNNELQELIADFLNKKEISNLKITGVNIQINAEKVDLQKESSIN